MQTTTNVQKVNLVPANCKDLKGANLQNGDQNCSTVELEYPTPEAKSMMFLRIIFFGKRIKNMYSIQLIIILLFLSVLGWAGNSKPLWTVTRPFEDRVLLEN